MSFTKAQVAEKVLARLVQDGEREDKLLLPDIVSWIDEALRTLGLQVADSLDVTVRNQLQTVFTIELTSGVGSLAEATGEDEPLIVKYPLVLVTHSSLSEPLLPLPSLTRLANEPANLDFGFYALNGGSIHTKSTNGSLTALTGDLSVTGNFIPAVGTLTDQLVSRLIDLIIASVK